MILWLRSAVFLTLGFVSAPSISIVLILMFWAPSAWRQRVLVSYCSMLLRAGDLICGLKVVVEGRENLPDRPSVLMIKHTSTLETYGHVPMFPQTSWVVKRELIWTPFVGWAISLVLNPIAINRGRGRSAVKQVIEQGKERLAAGIWVTIFPEGTRVAPGESRKYGISGAVLAKEAGAPIVPVAHNAGDFWRRREFIKRPGTVRFVIGPPIDATGRDPKETCREVQDWIEGKMRDISSAYQ